MAKDALERLFEDAANTIDPNISQYSIDEQLEIEDDDIFATMSDQSKDRLMEKVQKVSVDRGGTKCYDKKL